MCSIQDRLDLFFVHESRDTGLFAEKIEHNWMVNKCTRNSSFRAFKVDGLDVNGLIAYTVEKKH